MSLARRFSFAAATAVAVTVALAAVAVYILVRGLVLGEVDRTLREQVPIGTPGAQTFSLAEPVAGVIATRPTLGITATPPSNVVFERASDWRIVGAQLATPRAAEALLVRPDDRIRKVASGSLEGDLRSATIAGRRYRIITRQAGPGAVLQAARPLDETERVLDRLVWILAAVTAAAALLAGVAGRVVAGAVLAPIRRLAGVAHHVASTRDLRRRVPPQGHGELGQLADAFNSMLSALDDSARSQRQLVIDASHELRTPVASARTNLEVLRRAQLDETERGEVLDDVVAQLEELGTTIADVIELARSEDGASVHRPVRLDRLVAETVERAAVHAPSRQIELTTKPCIVNGPPERIARAVRNLLDNAIKWGPEPMPIEVTVADGAVTVRDHGPGIEPANLPRVFDRFWRAPEARSQPGSGLGLAIVSQVASDLGGTVLIEQATGGGTRARFSLPWTAADDEPDEPPDALQAARSRSDAMGAQGPRRPRASYHL